MSFDIASGLGEVKSKRRKSTRKSIYDKQREEETIRNATDRGYLRRMTVEFLNDNVGVNNHDLPLIGYMNVTALQLSSLGVLEMCVSLRICILPGNYITEFDALVNCVNLWVIDLHGNQIKKIPDCKFWTALKQLQIVLLHDNGISRLDTIHHLSSSASLLILTLYDTPLSLKKNYRHHVVNGIWSLKALDCHVVADEEIIEDTKMAGRFGAMQKSLRIDLNHGLTKESTLEEAVKTFEKMIAGVNKIQAKCCPVLMIQKMFRGYTVRKRFKYLMATRVWAATSIQRFYRYYKGITTSQDSVLPPPSSPFPTAPAGRHGDDENNNQQTSEHITRDDRSEVLTAADSKALESNDSKSSKTTGSSMRLPIYNKPSARDDELGFLKKSSKGGRNQVRKWGSVELVGEHNSNESAGSGTGIGTSTGTNTGPEDKNKKVTRRMTIDLMKLESTAMETIQSATCAVTIDSELGLERRSRDSKSKTSVDIEKQTSKKITSGALEEANNDDLVKKRRLKPEKIGKYRTVRVFLGPIVESKPEEVTSSDEDETNRFRLLGVKPPKQKNEPVVEMLLSKKEMGEDIRRALREHKKSLASYRKAASTSQKLTNDQKLFMRTHGTMGLACLRAVHQAYGDRERAQLQANRAERVAGMKERRELALGRLRTLRQDYQDNVLRDRIRDGVKIADALLETEKKQEQELGKISTQKVAEAMERRARQTDANFLKEFASHQTSVSQALRSHDYAELKKEKLSKMTESVRRDRESNLERQALVRKYMEHRQLMRQAEMAKTKAEINARLLDEANRRFMEVETRMKQTKNRLEQVKKFYPLPPLNVPSVDTPLGILSPAKFALWEACLQRDSRHCLDDTLSTSDACSDNHSQQLTS